MKGREGEKETWCIFLGSEELCGIFNLEVTGLCLCSTPLEILIQLSRYANGVRMGVVYLKSKIFTFKPDSCERNLDHILAIMPLVMPSLCVLYGVVYLCHQLGKRRKGSKIISVSTDQYRLRGPFTNESGRMYGWGVIVAYLG